MGIRQRESGEESESQFAEFTEAAAKLNPVVTLVMRLFAPPAVADNRIT